LEPGYTVFVNAIDPPTYIEMGSDMANVIVSWIGCTIYKLAKVFETVVFSKLDVLELSAYVRVVDILLYELE